MNYKILMVDDDRELLKMLNQYFTLKNYTVSNTTFNDYRFCLHY